MSHSVSSLGLALALACLACDERGSGKNIDAAAPISDARATQDAEPDAAQPTDAAAEEEAGTPELPREPADPKLTKVLLRGKGRLVGGERAACSHAPGSTADRWCAIAIPSAAGAADQLWVMNVSKAMTGTVPACDGSTPDCLKLTDRLWTGFAIYGDTHPTAHRFEGDTLIYHAEPAAGPLDPYRGGLWAWRPGWAQPQRLTSADGMLCAASHEHGAVYCLQNAVVERDPNNPFDPPRVREFDVVAGVPDGRAVALPVVTHVKQTTNDLVWRGRFTKDGKDFLYSAAPDGSAETVYAIKTSEIGMAAPKPIATDVAEWEISYDEQKLYFLRGYDRSKGGSATGTLMMAEFPSLANPIEMQKGILWFELLGQGEEVFSNVDRGLLVAYPGPKGRPSFGVLRDRTAPGDLLLLGSDADVAQVSLNARHTLYFQASRGAEFPSALLRHNDGSGGCRLTSDYRAETYGAGFADTSHRVFWIEFGRNMSQSEEGWYAQPETCGEKTKFGDFVRWYVPMRDDFVIFEGGDLADSTTWLEYTSLGLPTAGVPRNPRIVCEHPDGITGIVESAGSLWLLFGSGAADGGALYLHGPLVP
jgi:hypothetical protein